MKRRLALLALLALACGPKAPPEVADEKVRSPDAEAEAIVFPPDHESWVRVFDPERSWDGLTLDLYKRRIPILFDSNGRIVHAWPRARIRSRARLLPDGSIIGVGLNRGVLQLAWNGDVVREVKLVDRIPHHDLIELENGHLMVVNRPAATGWDSLIELDEAGRIVWEWKAEDHLQEFKPRRPNPRDVTHVNSVDELPPNPWFDAGDARFRPGNLLISARNLNHVFLIDRRTGEVLWQFKERLDLQHEARMIPAGLPRAGEITLLSNGFRGAYRYRQSELLQVNPLTGEIVWSYETPGFFTPIGGVVQMLPNGNLLVTSYRGSRIFEVTRRGEIVWQWTPPFPTSRAHRYAWDFAPQLAALRKPRVAVEPPPGYRHVDRPSYRFASRSHRRNLTLGERRLSVLEDNHDCEKVFFPVGAALTVAYGVDRAALQEAGRADRSYRFSAHLKGGAGGDVELFADVVEPGGEASRTRTVPLDDHAYEWLKLCVAADEVGGAAKTEGLAYWENPMIAVAADLAESDDLGDDDDDGDGGGLTEEEKQVQREHLKALGYVE